MKDLAIKGSIDFSIPDWFLWLIAAFMILWIIGKALDIRQIMLDQKMEDLKKEVKRRKALLKAVKERKV